LRLQDDDRFFIGDQVTENIWEVKFGPSSDETKAVKIAMVQSDEEEKEAESGDKV
jgi:hypothetical protein